MSEIRVDNITDEAGTGAPSVQSLFSVGGLIDGTENTRANYSTKVNLHHVIRHVGHRSHSFDNITFDISGSNEISEWTVPSSGSFTWAYVYISSDGSTFYISDNAPAFGNNTRVISGNEVLYLFPIYTDDTNFYKFTMTGSEYQIVEVATRVLYSGNRDVEGIQLYSNTGISSLDVVVDITDKLPDTHLHTNFILGSNYRFRQDSSRTGQAYAWIEAPRIYSSSTIERIIYHRLVRHINTPTPEGDYYPYEIQVSRNYVNSYNMDLTQFEVYYENSDSIKRTDGWSAVYVGFNKFIDRGVI